MAETSLARAQQWAATMHGHAEAGLVRAHATSHALTGPGPVVARELREEWENVRLRSGATRARGAGNRARDEEPDAERTCFERDRDRIVHSTAFRRLAGKTQVVVYPSDHQRTRLTHALEVAQIATSIARGIGANVALVDAIALGHDCGHGPGGHASEDAFDAFIPEGYDHGPWGADVVLTPLNLCTETLDGIRNHSWSRPAPATIEGEIVSWADRIAYCAHDLEDAIHAGIVTEADIPTEVAEVCGRTRREQLAHLRPWRDPGRRPLRRGRYGGHPSRRRWPRCGRSTTSASTSGRRRWPSPGPWSRCYGRWSSSTSSTRRRCRLRPPSRSPPATRSAPPSRTSPG